MIGPVEGGTIPFSYDDNPMLTHVDEDNFHDIVVPSDYSDVYANSKAIWRRDHEFYVQRYDAGLDAWAV